MCLVWFYVVLFFVAVLKRNVCVFEYVYCCLVSVVRLLYACFCGLCMLC